MKDFSISALEIKAKSFLPEPLGDNFLDTRYEWQKTANGVEWPYYRFFYRITQILEPRLVVELGGWRGTAAAHFAAGYHSEMAQVITIDHHTDEGDQYNQLEMKQVCERYKNITYVQGWTNPEAADRERGHHSLGDAPCALPVVEQAGKIDILFIDSWHNYENAMLDWMYYRPLLNSPALVICDDIQAGGDKYSPISGMYDFWQELPEPKFLNANLHPGTNMGFVKL